MGKSFILFVPIFFALAATNSALANPIEVDFTFHFREIRSVNEGGFSVGDRLTIGVQARPNPYTPGDPSGEFSGPNDTTVSAHQDGTTIQLPFLRSPAFAEQYALSIPFQQSLTDAWSVTVSNPTSANTPVTVATEAVQSTGPVEFVANMALVGSGTTPTLEWKLPATQTADQVRILIQDLDAPSVIVGGDFKPIIFQQTIGANVESFEMPAGVLELGRNYSVGIRVEELRASGEIDNASVSFFSFQALENVPNNPVFLPTVDPVGGPSGGPVYSFNVDVQGGQQILIDPVVAVGYDYAIGVGDPLFASVTLPDIGDGIFDLFLFDGANNPFDSGFDLLAGVTFDFTTQLALLAAQLGFDPSNGIDMFRILGIEPSAGLDPYDTTAFITGLTFAEDGTFTGTMTPISVEVVPLPATVWLLISALGGMGLVGWRRRAQSLANA